MPVFTRSDRHALGAFLAQPKVFTTAEFTLLETAAPTLALWHLEEEELASPEIAEHSTARRICTLCDHESVCKTRFPCHPHVYQQPHSRSDNDSGQSGTQYTLAEFRVDKLVQEETSALISAETNVDRRAWIEECNSGDCDLLARDIFYEARLYDTTGAADTYPSDRIRDETTEDSFATCIQQAQQQQKREHQAQSRRHGVARECRSA
jgi:hypothetical protein